MGERRRKPGNDWFDGLKTLKLVNYFTTGVYPLVNMFGALREILSLTGHEFTLDSVEEIPPLEEQIRFLKLLRMIT